MRLFSFLISDLVNDEAVKLKAFCDMVVARYLSLNVGDLQRVIARDFPNRQSVCDPKSTSFVFKELPKFQFNIDHWDQDNRPKTLTVHGRGEYTGYMLQGFDAGEEWASLVSDGLAYNATGAAKKLARTMTSKFGIRDNSE